MIVMNTYGWMWYLSSNRVTCITRLSWVFVTKGIHVILYSLPFTGSNMIREVSPGPGAACIYQICIHEDTLMSSIRP